MRCLCRLSMLVLLVMVLLPSGLHASHYRSPIHRHKQFQRTRQRNRIEKPSFDFPAKRLTTKSPSYYVSDDSVDLYESFSGFDPNTESRFSNLTIGDKALDMIQKAQTQIVASVFLFDTMVSSKEPPRDIVRELTDAVVAKKKECPEINITLVLDPINKSYGQCIAPAIQELRSHGVDVFISDLLTTKSAKRPPINEGLKEIGRGLDNLSFGLLGQVAGVVFSPAIPVSNPLHEKGVSPKMIWNALSLKANHRKLLVTDIGDDYEALISSANPHNASIPSTNYAVSVKGDLAKYVYMNIREDVLHSIKVRKALWGSLNSKPYRKHYATQKLPPLEIGPDQRKPSPSRPVEVIYLTESRIRDEIILMLNDLGPDDRVRIQMFYLSDVEIVDLMAAASRQLHHPMWIILDPSKDAFNSIKDGTPNRQVAAYLMDKQEKGAANLTIRWYETHGEQNHAKIMSISNEATGKYELLTGSTNWTGKNLKDINLEANLRVVGSQRLNAKFDQLFDLFWSNSDGMLYTIPYEGKYQQHTGLKKWINGERWGYVSW